MKRTFGLQWHITNECDQRCKHCYIWRKFHNEGLQVVPTIKQCKSTIQKFINFCEEMSVIPYLSITGGDPLLYEDFWKLLEIVRKNKIFFTILGNPFHLTKEVATRLKEMGCVSYQMSIDGTRLTHDSLRKSGSFEATLGAIEILRRANIRSMIMMTVSTFNYKECPYVARLCVEHGVNNFTFARYCPTHKDTEFNIPAKEYRGFLSDMWKTYSSLIDFGTKFALKDHLWVPFLYEEGLYKLHRQKNIVFDGCNCGISHMTLLPNGVVYACRRFDSRVGNIYKQSLKTIFLSQEMNKYRNFDNLIGCRSCELLNYCRGCHAVSAGTTGSFFDKDPQCWRA